jgi:hypothetical protein
MRTQILLAAGTVALGCGLMAASPASAQSCDAYSGACENPGTVVVPPTGTGGGTNAGTVVNTGAGSGTTLPFTGAELLLLGVVGVGALGGGTAMVVAGRRRPVVA